MGIEEKKSPGEHPRGFVIKRAGVKRVISE